MDLKQLLSCVESNSVIRYRLKLSTASPDGIVYPPTYAAANKPKKKDDPPHLPFREAFVDGERRDIVVLDSPQSQSNRVELALLATHQAERIRYPDITVHFPEQLSEPIYSVLQLSHRIYDAVLRACTLKGKPFFESDVGKAIQAARIEKATALFEHAPVTLVLGAWDSNGGGGPMAAKIARLLTSEIIGLDARRASVSSTKFDPMDIRSNVAELIPSDDPYRRFTIKANDAKKGGPKSEKPSKFGFGSVPSSDVQRAAVISGAIQTSLLSCSGLRRISFPDSKGVVHRERDQAGRAALAAMGLYGLIAQNESGYLLRSRCELLPVNNGCLELVGRTLEDIKQTSLDTDSALALLKEALTHATKRDLVMRSDVLALQADDRLQALVHRSRKAAAIGEEPDES